MNVYAPNDRTTPATLPYGSRLEEQDELLENVCHTISRMKIPEKNCLQLFQKGMNNFFFSQKM